MKTIGAILLFVCPLVAQTSSNLAVVETSSAVAAAPLSSPPISPAYAPPDYREKIDGKTFYRWSLAALVAGNVADSVSSWRRVEANPVLASSGGTFGVQSVLLKAGLVGVSFVIERWALHHNPHLYKSFAWINIAVGGGLGAVAARNESLK